MGQNGSFSMDINSGENLWDNFVRSPSHPLIEGTRDDVDLQSMLNDEGMIVDLLLNTFQESSMSNSELNNFFTATSSSYSTGNTHHVNVAVPFPNPKDYYKTTANADLIQPGLGSLQPNLDDVDFDLNWLNIPPPTPQIQSNGKLIKNTVIQEENTFQQQQPSTQPMTKCANDMIASNQATVITNMSSTSQLQNNQHYQAPPVQPQARPVGGGKHRSILAHQQHQHMPYSTQKPKSPTAPVHKNQNGGGLLTHNAQRYQTMETNTTVLPEHSYKSELVQLLKSETNKPSPVPQVLNNANVQQQPQSNGYHELTNQQPVTQHVYLSIPPPLATDYQQENQLKNYRGLTHTPQYAEHRRSVHINAEQNRRTSIKHGFEELRSLIPSLKDVPASSHKISKAALLTKGGDYIRQMKSECLVMDSEAEQLKNAIERLELEVSSLQGYLPAHKVGGVQGTTNVCGALRQKKASEDRSKINMAFNHHVASGTSINWKYYAFSRLMKPLLDTYVDSVAGSASGAELDHSINRWLEDKCSLIHMRQIAVTSLKNISIKTNILREPRRMPHDVLELSRQSDEN